jgi:release factor glutamine methyltransferase
MADVRELLETAQVADPRREADALYAAVVCGSASTAFLNREQPIAAAVRDRLMLAAERLAAGWPSAYAAGRANFRGHWLAVDQRVLIPRPETEGLVDLVLKTVETVKTVKTVADIGTGSGAIAIALALEPGILGVIATDISADALNVALENAASLGVKERISFRRGDLLLALLGEAVDVIVSNPPYVATGEWQALESNVRNHEPRLALDGGADGLVPYRGLVTQAREALTPGGLLALEVDARRAQQTAALAVQAGFERVEVRDDLFGRPRYLLGRQPEQS